MDSPGLVSPPIDLLEQSRAVVQCLTRGRAEDDALAVQDGVPFFSILATYYQGTTSDEEFQRFLASLAAQTYRNFEVILFHDGPLDHRVPCDYAIHQTPERRGQWGHDLRAKALRRATGIYILHTNADNEYAPTALEELHAFLSVRPADIVIGAVDMVGMVTTEIGFEYPGGKRDPSHVTRFGPHAPLYRAIDLMQLCARRSTWSQYGFVGRDHSADGRLFEKMVAERGYVPLEVLIGKHY